MPIILRRNTFPTFPPDYLDKSGKPTMPFRAYQTKIWEPWMRKGYSDKAVPFLSGPETNYLKSLGTHSLATSEQQAQRALFLLNYAGLTEPLPDELERIARWDRLSKGKREEILLDCWMSEHVSFEPVSYTMGRSYAPECTLAALAGKGCDGILPLLLACKPSASFDAFTSKVPLIPNDAWERMWCCGKCAPPTPFSRAKRAFVESGIAGRACYLFNFILMWKLKLDHSDFSFDKIGLIPPPAQLNAQNAPTMFALDDNALNKHMKAAVKSASSSKQCEGCCANTVKHPELHLTCCGRCKKVGRMAWYCNAEHQKQHWPIHKRVCGTPIGSTRAEPDVLKSG